MKIISPGIMEFHISVKMSEEPMVCSVANYQTQAVAMEVTMVVPKFV